MLIVYEVPKGSTVRCVDCERTFDPGEFARGCRLSGGFACDDREACEARAAELPPEVWVETLTVTTATPDDAS